MSNPALVVLGALVSQQRDPHAVPEDEWPTIVSLAVQHGLGPMLLWSLRQNSVNAHDHPAMHPLIESAHQSAMTNALLEEAQVAVGAALREANIPALWLKGAALARTVYPQPGLRPMGDLDVLVPYEVRDEALEVVRALGYDFYTLNTSRPYNSGSELSLRLTPHHYDLKGGIGKNVVLELHIRLLAHDSGALSSQQLQWFWGQKQTLKLDDGETFDSLAPEAHLLYLCAHAVLQHGETHSYLLRFFDLHQIITQAALDWDVVVDQAVELGWTFAVENAMHLSSEYFATPVPTSVMEALVERRPAHDAISRALRLQGHGSRWEHMRSRIRDLPFREQPRYILSLLFPTFAFMRQRYNIRPGWPIWPYYFYRWYDHGSEVAWSIWKRLTGQYR